MKNCVAGPVAVHSLALKAGPFPLLLAIVPLLILLLLPSASATDYYIQLHEVNLSLYAPPPSTICLDAETEIVADCIATPFVTGDDGQQLPLGEDGTWYIAAVCTWDWDMNDANDEKANPTPLGSPPDDGAECHWLIGYDEPGVYTIRVTCTAELRQVGTDAVLDHDGPVTSNTVDLTVVEADIDAAGVDDADEDIEGAYVRCNDDDDDGDGVIDHEDSEVNGEDDLLELTIQPVQPAGVLSSTDKVAVTWEGSAELYASSDKVGLVQNGAEFPLSALPKTVYLEPESPVDEITVTLACMIDVGTEQEQTCIDEVKVSVVTAELAVDSNVDADTDVTALGPDDSVEEQSPGMLLCINNDDGNLNGVADLNDPGDSTETSLLPVLLEIRPTTAAGAAVDLVLVSGADCLKVWTDEHKGQGNQVQFTNGVKTYSPASSLPAILHLEGIQQGEVRLRIDYTIGGATCDSDTVVITVVPDHIRGSAYGTGQ